MPSGNEHIVDSFQRRHNYLRISLTDKCNLRCRYCMPVEKMKFMPTASLMQANEIIDIAGEFNRWGVDKIRLTGGEPLIRKDVNQILKGLAELPVEISMTTNAYFLDEHVHLLRDSGVRHLNISLDTLKAERFLSLTRRNGLQKTLENIKIAARHGFHVKLNVVLMKGINDDEILDFATFAEKHQLEVRFIEFMPFQDNKWNMSHIVPEKQIIQTLETSYVLKPLVNGQHDTSRKFSINQATTIGFISSITNPFCGGCNRMRLTADGKLKNCLFSNDELDLLAAHRSGADLKPLVKKHMLKKHFARGGKPSFSEDGAEQTYQENRKMIAIGG